LKIRDGKRMWPSITGVKKRAVSLIRKEKKSLSKILAIP